jgi:hypothetical protein
MKNGEIIKRAYYTIQISTSISNPIAYLIYIERGKIPQWIKSRDPLSGL